MNGFRGFAPPLRRDRDGRLQFQGGPTPQLERTCSAEQRTLVREWLVHVGDRVDAQFSRMDRNGDGFVTRAELVRAVEGHAAKWQALPDALLAMGDVDEDGKLSLGEFRALGRMLTENAALQQALVDPHDGVVCDICKDPIRGTSSARNRVLPLPLCVCTHSFMCIPRTEQVIVTSADRAGTSTCATRASGTRPTRGTLLRTPSSASRRKTARERSTLSRAHPCPRRHLSQSPPLHPCQ